MNEASGHRKRLRRWEFPGEVRFITFSCYHRRNLLVSTSDRDLVVAAMGAAKEAEAKPTFALFAWVIMPNHVHLLVLPNTTWDHIATSMKVRAAKGLLARWRSHDDPILSQAETPQGATRVWQRGGGFDRNVRDLGEFAKAVQYIHRNPVSRGLVSTPREWRWSSARWWLGEREDTLPCDPFPCSGIDWDSWGGFV